MAHWIVEWKRGPFDRDVPELDVLDLDRTGGLAVPGHPGFVTDPKQLPLRAVPTAPVFRPSGYPWVVLATDDGKLLLGGAYRFRTPTRLRKGSLAAHCLDPWALHRRALDHNWDHGSAALWQIIESPTCDLATALMIFWRGGAGFLQQWSTLADVPRTHREHWPLLQEIEQRVLAGTYSHGRVYYDPAAESRIYEAYAHAFVRRIPDALRRPTGVRPTPALPLHAAIEDGDATKVGQLLAAGADPRQRDAEGVTALGRVLRAHRPDLLALLFDHGLEHQHLVGILAETRELPLFLVGADRLGPDRLLPAAAAAGWRDGVVAMLERHPDLETRDYRDRTALFEAVDLGDEVIARCLLDAGADPNTRSEHSVLQQAAHGQHIELARLLLERGAHDVSALVFFAEPMPDLLVLALTNGGNATEALQDACRAASTSCVDLAVAHGADVNGVDEYGRRPLHCVVFRDDQLADRAAIVRALLAAGADPTIPSEPRLPDHPGGELPWQIAQANGNSAAVALLQPPRARGPVG
jgi:ankyrin repeat protein